MPSIYTTQHRVDLTWLAEVHDSLYSGHLISLQGGSDGFPAVHLAGLQIHEAEQIAAELLAAAKRARANVQAQNDAAADRT